jgi:hypothetical protein
MCQLESTEVAVLKSCCVVRVKKFFTERSSGRPLLSHPLFSRDLTPSAFLLFPKSKFHFEASNINHSRTAPRQRGSIPLRKSSQNVSEVQHTVGKHMHIYGEECAVFKNRQVLCTLIH